MNIDININEETYGGLYNLLKPMPLRTALDDIARKNIARIRRQEKIKIAIQISCLSEWPCEELVKELQAIDRFEVTVVIVWQRNLDAKFEITALMNHFNASGLPFKVADGSFSIKDFDIVIFTSPYVESFANFGEKDIPLTTLLYYIPYGYFVAKIQPIQFNLQLHNIARRIYATTKVDIDMAARYCDSGNSNMLFAGYSKMDRVVTGKLPRADWKISPNARGKVKKIIYAPHHSINALPFVATFPKNYRAILEYAKIHQDTTSWVFKPHPLLRMSSVQTGVFSNLSEFENYCAEWDSLPNARYIDGEYHEWMQSSDCMIFDSMSFMAEYLFFDKPALFLTRKETDFNELGTAIFKLYEHADGGDMAKIKDFIENYVDTPLKQARRRNFFNDYLNYYQQNGDMTAEKFIFNDIVKELLC